jgi:hypothetical protein
VSRIWNPLHSFDTDPDKIFHFYTAPDEVLKLNFIVPNVTVLALASCSFTV